MEYEGSEGYDYNSYEGYYEGYEGGYEGHDEGQDSYPENDSGASNPNPKEDDADAIHAHFLNSTKSPPATPTKEESKKAPPPPPSPSTSYTPVATHTQPSYFPTYGYDSWEGSWDASWGYDSWGQ